MHPADIKANLAKRNITQKYLAEILGVWPMSVNRVINKTSVSDRIMKKIAELIDLPVAEVFPEYYCSAPKRSTSGRAASDQPH